MIVKILTEQHLEYQSIKRGCRGSSGSTLVKMPHCHGSYCRGHNVAQCTDAIFSYYILCHSRVKYWTDFS